MTHDPNEVVVIGAGVIGLTTAVCLAESDLRVEVRTAELPQQTSSAVAGAMCDPTLIGSEEPVLHWWRESLAEFLTLASKVDTGVHLKRGRLVSKRLDSTLQCVGAAPGVVPCTNEDLAGFRLGYWIDLPLLDMPLYLDYLSRRFVAANGRFRVSQVDDLRTAANDARILVNCTGVGARHLVPDPLVRPVKGQHVILEDPGLEHFFYEENDGSSWVGYFPHGKRVVLGGVAVADDWDTRPNARIADEILTRCIGIEPRLARCRILGAEAGLRPKRPSVRLEIETLDQGICIHNYGHGGVGVSLSWGCARQVAAMAQQRLAAS